METSNILFEIIRCELSGAEPEGDFVARITELCLGGGSDCEGLYRLASAHDMAHIVADFLGKKGLLGKDELSEKYKRAQMLAVCRYERMRYELNAISELFEAKGVAHILLKGSVVRDYYKNPYFRQSGDIDILVSREKLDFAVGLLCERLGYTAKRHRGHDVPLKSPSGVLLELHFTLFEHRNQKYTAQLSGAWERAILLKNSRYTYRLSDADFMFYHVAHMAKHFEGGSCGIRPIVDIFVLKNAGIDISVCRDMFMAAGLDKFAENAVCLSSVWFSGASHTDTTELMGSFMIRGGVFGDTKKRAAAAQVKKGAKAKYMFSRIFVCRKSLAAYFPIVKKCPALVPVFQVYRWFILIFKGRIKRLRAQYEISNEEKNYLVNLLKSVGLK